MNCFVLGSGSFGSALAWVLASKGFAVDQWCRRPARAVEIDAGRNTQLPGVQFPAGILAVLPGTRRGPYDLAISAVPAQHLAAVLAHHGDDLPRGIPWVSATKGIEVTTLRRPSEILRDAGVAPLLAILSGPSHAEEVVRAVPTAVVLGHEDPAEGRYLQRALSMETFRVYWNGDALGVELAGALKNVIALAAGIAIGQGFGDNTLAALVTRGAVEMARLGVALGGQAQTFHGLSGVGDLMVTCFSDHSRNRRFGVRLGRGESPAQVMQGLSHVVEGVPTARAVVELGRAHGVELPIAEEVHRIVHEGKAVDQGIRDLLGRSLKEE